MVGVPPPAVTVTEPSVVKLQVGSVPVASIVITGGTVTVTTSETVQFPSLATTVKAPSPAA